MAVYVGRYHFASFECYVGKFRAFLVLVFTVGIVSAEGEPLRIMPLGDSITQGSRDSYRRPLWFKLRQAGMNVDFVGSMSRGYGLSFKTQDFDGDHEGHWGWRADEVLNRVDEWITRSNPDIVLLHLGTNDIGIGQPIEETTSEIGWIVQRLRQYKPDIHILLAAIIPVANETVTNRITKFNHALAQLAETVDSLDSRVVLVDQFTGFDGRQDTYDGTHPNSRGNRKMADKWFAAIRSILKNRSMD